MKYPLHNWLNLQNGYTFGQPTNYTRFHRGIDKIAPTGTPIKAPTDGNVVEQIPAWEAPQGGNTVWFKDSEGRLWRFLHLDRFGKGGAVKEGQVIGYVGSTGLSSGPHVHVDISSNGKLELENINNFVDPEIYIKERLMSNPHRYDLHIIRHQDTGQFAYVTRGAKQEFNNSNGALALTTFLQRLPKEVAPQSRMTNVRAEEWDGIPSTTKFFPT